MKNKIVYLLIALLTISLWGCEKEYDTVTRVTYFPDIAITGQPVVFSAQNATYTDQGAKSTENGKEIQTKVVSNVNAAAVGSYSVIYSAVNVDGFSATAQRKVIIYDTKTSTSDISGQYSGDVMRNGTRGYKGNPITLTKVAGTNGIYQISDWISGFYDVGTHYQYGPDYRFVGYIQITSENKVVLLDMSNPWGDPFISVVGTYDPATKKISYTAKWLTHTFVVDLTKV
ncbi:MAG: DUF5012 domain-containing protein [Prolixibacteraceae bacterium]|nr:DUF5012 domain-containing protein [Prolixibacteraceae bacterium]